MWILEIVLEGILIIFLLLWLTPQPKANWEGKDLFQFSGHIYRWGKLEKEFKQEPEAEATEEHFLLVHRLILRASYTHRNSCLWVMLPIISWALLHQDNNSPQHNLDWGFPFGWLEAATNGQLEPSRTEGGKPWISFIQQEAPLSKQRMGQGFHPHCAKYLETDPFVCKLVLLCCPAGPCWTQGSPASASEMDRDLEVISSIQASLFSFLSARGSRSQGHLVICNSWYCFCFFDRVTLCSSG